MLPKEKLKKLYKSGLSLEDIAKKEKWPYYTVRYWMEKHNIPRRSRSEACYYGYWNRNGGVKIFYSSKCRKKITIKEIKKMYYREGCSAREIGEFFERSASAVYRFMKKYDLARRSPSETNSLVYEKKPLSYNLKKNLTSREEKLKVAGVMLYWAEGDKNKTKMARRRGATVDFANSDPEMIKFFLKFLRQICGVDEGRLRIRLYCYANQDIKSLRKYWSELTSIPLNQFTKPYVREDFLLEKADKMKYGLVHVSYCDKKLFLQIQNWICQYLKKL